MSYTAREVELFQLWTKRAEVDRLINMLKEELREIRVEVTRIQALVTKEKTDNER